MKKMGKTEELVFSTLKNAEKGLTLTEIAERTGESRKKVFRALLKLFEEETIDCKDHQYRPVSK
jgi:DNA-binding IclR family transcriptional regulator